MSAIGLAAGLLVIVAAPAIASAHTCGSNWCSGSDGSTTHNIQGNGPQIYSGEVGVYFNDIGGGSSGCSSGPIDDGSCFSTTGANLAYTKYLAGTGMGVWFFYFLGGAKSTYASRYPTDYCFGWAQGYYAVSNAHNDVSKYYSSAWVMTMDIEAGTTGAGTYGWSTSAHTADRSVFNGFTDYVADRSSATSTCTYRDGSGYKFQYEVYSSKTQWNYAFGTGSAGQISGTLKYTYEYSCYSTWPGGTFTPSANKTHDAEWFATTNYRDVWQFKHNCVSSDYDELHEPDYLPVFGATIGT